MFVFMNIITDISLDDMQANAGRACDFLRSPAVRTVLDVISDACVLLAQRDPDRYGATPGECLDHLLSEEQQRAAAAQSAPE